MKPAKVLILIDRLGRGGVAQVAINVALSLDRTKYSPVVCTTRAKPTHGQDEILRRAGVPLIELNRRSRLEILSWRPLWDILPSVSILHTHLSGSNFWGRLWGRLFRVPIVITQDHTAADEKHRIEHVVDRLLSPLSDRIITVSEYDRDLSIRLEKLPPEKILTIYNGIDVARFDYDLSQTEARRRAGLPTDKRLIAIIARLAGQKNHHVLFQALTLLPPSLRQNIHCLVVGTGELEQMLPQEAAELGLQEQVSFLGERTDVPVILHALDALVLPSHWECLPVVILEALAAGCPVVASAVGGVPEVLRDVGWPLVEPGDAGTLAEAITAVLQMPAAQRDQIACTGRQVVRERFSKEESVVQLEQLYDSLLVSTDSK